MRVTKLKHPGGRPRIHKDNAAKQRAYRARVRAAAKRKARKKAK